MENNPIITFKFVMAYFEVSQRTAERILSQLRKDLCKKRITEKEFLAIYHG